MFGIVIPTYNEEGNIERLLASIASQQGCTYIVVVVDQGSSDRTAEIVRSRGWPVIDVPRSLIYSPPARSRNVGARSTASSIILHLDADMELQSQSFLSDLALLVAQGHRAAIIPENDVVSGFWANCKALERSCYRGTNMESARVVTRELFMVVGGYDEEVASGEDFLITRFYKQHTQVVRANSLFLNHHIGSLSLRRLLQKKYAYGKTARAYLNKAPNAGGSTAWAIIRTCVAAYLRNWRLLLQHPLLYLSIFPLRALELVAVQAGARAATWVGATAAPLPDGHSTTSGPGGK